MRFQTGVLGVVVIIIAISCTLMGSWIMSMDVEETEVTKYNPLADIVGLFDSEQTPTFTEYNPSTNYTGYYTDTSIIGDTRYFDGVDYSASKPNNYRLNLAPTSSVTDTKTIPTDGAVSGGIEAYIKDLESVRGIMPYAMTVSQLIELWDYSDYNRITIQNTDSSIDWSDYSDIERSWVAIIPKNWVERSGPVDMIVFKNPDLTIEEITKKYGSGNYRNPTVSCSYEKATSSVQIYYDDAMTQSAGVYSPDDVYVLFGTRNADYMELGNTVNTAAYIIPDATYMDPSAGVVML